ncbi:hypothetical protein BCR33DRAFT_713718 [Rhizoclosmatium globosum]|uniref:Uncharacterized protein n=1 Tax=Rhizoclosmatium globosum TaxID=329046 RepID=A0A1Y2CSL3_9FUNG|nr:hypothetical protein BCR33DRAFT_713718 [Rhizoclosmatium globosum]|eukprot:ORY49365.1 hypothetical protein BCR33DRAFT_713718 [Rhizoclosmatium globosum]
MATDLNWCSCGKATQPQSLYCSTTCKDKEDHPASSLVSWSLDALDSESSSAAPIAFYPHNHIQQVLQSPRSPFINPNHLPASTLSQTPATNPTASPRFSSAKQSVRNSPFAFSSTPLANTAASGTQTSASIPFLALPMSEIDLPPPQLDQRSRKPSQNTNGLLSSPFTAPIPGSNNSSNGTSRTALHSPYLGAGTGGARNMLASPKLSGRIVPQSPFMNGGQDFSSTAGDVGMVTVSGQTVGVDDLHASLAFRSRK